MCSLLWVRPSYLKMFTWKVTDTSDLAMFNGPVTPPTFVELLYTAVEQILTPHLAFANLLTVCIKCVKRLLYFVQMSM